MPDFLVPYSPSITAYVALSTLLLVQMIVGDVAGIRAGHVPGMPVTTGHGDFHFRATRALANTNESLPTFLLLSLAAMFLGASPSWTNGLVIVFVAGRAAHMLAYYADVRLLRSAMFAVGFASMIGLAICAVAALV